MNISNIRYKYRFRRSINGKVSTLWEERAIWSYKNGLIPYQYLKTMQQEK